MALDLAEVLAMPGQPDMHALGQRFVAWVAEGPKDVGNTTRLAIDHLAAGVNWDRAGVLALETRGERGASSNGSLMRTAPVAVRYHQKPDDLREVARHSSLVTHAEERCQWSCVALNQGIGHFLNGGDLTGLVEAAVHGIPVASVVDTVAGAGAADPASLSGTGFVLNGLQIAFWAVQNTTSLEDAIVAAVMIGDDTDTNAAITGALAGAMYGVSALPERWLSLLHHRERLTDLADRLISLESI
jgi:ADP-ribosyl-[dinitrogen reductase] hydrolase